MPIDATWVKLIVELGALGILGYQIFLNAKKDERIWQYLNEHLNTTKENTKALQCLCDAITALKEAAKCSGESK